MDKYNLTFDVIEHPEKYTSEHLAEIMSDPEIRAIYTLVCKTDSAIEASKEVDVDAEWDRFADKYTRRSVRSYFRGRAASVAAIIASGILTVAAGIAVTVAIGGYKGAPKIDEVTAEAQPVSVEATPADTAAVGDEAVSAVSGLVIFEDEPLEKIMTEIAAIYHVDVNFNNKEAASLHLYYRLDTSLPLNEVITRLNTFESFNITQEGNTLSID